MKKTITEVTNDDIHWLTVTDRMALPTLAQGQADDLKVDTGTRRVWLSRCTAADGLVGSRISHEMLYEGRWVACDVHKRRIDQHGKIIDQ